MIQHFLKGAIFIVLLYACSPNNVKNDTAINTRINLINSLECYFLKFNKNDLKNSP